MCLHRLQNCEYSIAVVPRTHNSYGSGSNPGARTINREKIMNNIIVPPGISGRMVESNFDNVDLPTVAAELALLNLGDFEALDIKIDLNMFRREISAFDSDWVDYLPRLDRPNNRQSLVLSNLPGKSHRDNPSLPQACVEAGRRLSENDFNQKTEVYKHCKSIHPLLDEFQPLGRSFIVRSHVGGYFVPHRDHPQLPRESFRIVVFLNNCGPMEYDWIMGHDTKLNIEMGRAYYVNTRKVHRTVSWVNNSQHLILNIPFTPDNVKKTIGHLLYRH